GCAPERLQPHAPVRRGGGTKRGYQAGTRRAIAGRPSRAATRPDPRPEDLGRVALGVDRTRPTLLPALPRLLDPTAAAAHAPSADPRRTARTDSRNGPLLNGAPTPRKDRRTMAPKHQDRLPARTLA